MVGSLAFLIACLMGTALATLEGPSAALTALAAANSSNSSNATAPDFGMQVSMKVTSGGSMLSMSSPIKLSAKSIEIEYDASSAPGWTPKDWMGLFMVSEKEASKYNLAVDVGVSKKGKAIFTFTKEVVDKIPIGVAMEMRYFPGGKDKFIGKSQPFKVLDDNPIYKIQLPYTFGHEPFGWQVPHVACGDNLQLAAYAPADHNPKDIISWYSVDLNHYSAYTYVGDFKQRRQLLTFPWKSAYAPAESQLFDKVRCGTVYQLRYFDVNGNMKNASTPFRILRDEIFTVMAPPLYKLGNDLEIDFDCDLRAPLSTWIGIAPFGACKDIPTCSQKIVAWQYAKCKGELPMGTYNSVTFSANWMEKKLKPNVRYDVFYFVHGTVAAARDDFLCLPNAASDFQLVVDRTNFDLIWDRYMMGENIWVHWKGPADHDPEDWIALHEKGLCEPVPGGAITFDPCYKAKMLVGEAGKTTGSLNYKWDQGEVIETLKDKLHVGRKYFYRMYKKNSYVPLAESLIFEVLPATPPGPPVPYIPTKTITYKGTPSLSAGIEAMWTSTKPHSELDWVGLYKNTDCVRNPPGAYGLDCIAAPKLVGGLKKIVGRGSSAGKVYWKAAELAGVDTSKKYQLRYFTPKAIVKALSDPFSIEP